jgi:hypothetical protein
MTSTFKVVRGDVVIDRTTGRPVQIEGRVKLRQDVAQLLTQQPNAEGFGAGLDDLIGIPSDPFSIRAQISRNIRASIRAMQQLQDRFHFTARTDQERLQSIASLTVGEAQQDGQVARTTFAFRLSVRSVAGIEVPVTGQLVTPI